MNYKCKRCGLVNFADAKMCARCGGENAKKPRMFAFTVLRRFVVLIIVYLIAVADFHVSLIFSAKSLWKRCIYAKRVC